MSYSERGVSEREDKGIAPPSDLGQKIHAIIEKEQRILAPARLDALQYLTTGRSRIIPLLQERHKLVGGAIIQTDERDFFENSRRLRTPRGREVISMVIPISEETVLTGLLWKLTLSPIAPDAFEANAIIVEVFPKGDMFVHGDPTLGTSYSTFKERKKDKRLEAIMIAKAFQFPRHVQYYLTSGYRERRLIYPLIDQNRG